MPYSNPPNFPAVTGLPVSSADLQVLSDDIVALRAGLQPVLRVIEAGTTWSKPANLVFARVKVQGAGGGGGGAGGTEYPGAGGASGGMAWRQIGAADLASSISVEVGAGGAGGALNSEGAKGGSSTFGTYAHAEGGWGGGAGGLFVPGGIFGVPGTAEGGDLNFSGHAGFSGIRDQNQGGFGGASPIGGRGGWGGIFIGPAINGEYGGGGGGAHSLGTASYNAGAGGDGVVVVEEWSV